ncbi:GntR family transcriptional regulator [Carboxydochorda subterranea]|uniref:GntR family transcriptional regulator n=1 Tax=Carboxydichorda subterranea TaxID=3109565 RepID=A0ABZ1BWQ0_9FIRM|nr:GntR family transcriptional regulator [Limnochorda sp. L945t]WRP17231.1 GntR family transcriptional regulator [Limnochorda sp. L945t]
MESPRPIYLQIIDEVKRAMARRDLLPGDRIPSQRELAQMLRVNPNTVQRAFREMEVLGLVETVRGEGTFVRDDPALLSQVRSEMARQAVAHFVKQIRGLGFAEEEAVSMVRAAFRQSEPEGDRRA